ncbi:MAG: lipid-binding SYLF domain-containing protein [Thermovirgaceae bacterium]
MGTSKVFCKNMAIVAVSATLMLACTVAALAATPQERIDKSVSVLREMAGEKDSWRMGKLLSESRGVAIFPSVVKAGLVIGGQHGEGFLLLRNPSTGQWSGPSFASITGASWGLQIGVQSIGLVMVIANDDGVKGFMADQVKLSGDLSVAAGPVGRHTEAGTDTRFKASIYSYTIAKGLFAGMSLEGAVVRVDRNANNAYWGEQVTAPEALKRSASDSRIRPVLHELEGIIAKTE